MAEKGVRCSLECVDREGSPRYCPPGSEYTICPTCRANIANWSTRLQEAKNYFTQLGIRARRIGGEVLDATAGSYLAKLKAKRRRRAA
jgi:hypothetical protein